MTERGAFIAFEGGEGSGKSTQAALLATRRDALLTREPGGTVVGERVRGIFLDPVVGHVDPWAEVLLMAAARAQHVADVIEPALAAGRDVVTDRFTGSSLAYQGHGRGLPVQDVARISTFATHGTEPDVVVLLDVSAETGASRLGSSPDRMESAGLDFHRRVVAAYDHLAAEDPLRWVVLDATKPPEEVHGGVMAALESLLVPVP